MRKIRMSAGVAWENCFDCVELLNQREVSDSMNLLLRDRADLLDKFTMIGVAFGDFALHMGRDERNCYSHFLTSEHQDYLAILVASSVVKR
jgi:hypothetical protein